MRIMALDVGDNRIGIAVADKEVKIAIPLGVLEKKNCDVVEEIRRIINEQEVEKLVVGLPKKLDGEIGEQAEKVQLFINELQERIKIEVIFWDERLTTVEASKKLKELYRRKKIKKIIDASAAMLILQSYLDYEDTTNQP
jgi:putative Holliday junction resolvase